MKVLNLKNLKYQLDTRTMIYIGRPRGNDYRTTHWGNPFSQIKISKASIIVASREEAVSCFEKWIRGTHFTDVEPERRKWILENLHLLKGKNLVCWCAPKSCHGEIYLKLLKEKTI